MSSARVKFSISGKEFSWLDKLKDASDDEVAEFRWDCRWALYSLNDECLRRNAKDTKPTPISDFTKTIEENAQKIKQAGELLVSQESNLAQSKSFLKNLAPTMKEEKRASRFCQELCWQVTKQTSCQLTLLLIASFGRSQLGKLRDEEGIEVLRYLRKNQTSLTDYVRDVLGAKAVAYGLQSGR